MATDIQWPHCGNALSIRVGQCLRVPMDGLVGAVTLASTAVGMIEKFLRFSLYLIPSNNHRISLQLLSDFILACDDSSTDFKY